MRRWLVLLSALAVVVSAWTVAPKARAVGDPVQIAKLAAADGTRGNVARSVAVDGDTIVVGATGRNGGQGAVLVFTENPDGSITQVAELTASDAATGDNFGGLVAVHGDTIVTGAFRDDDGGESSGSVYVFAKPAAGWTDSTQTAKLTAGDAAAGDGLGYRVDVHDGTVAASAISDDRDGVPNAGSVYVFVRPTTGWADATQSAKLTSSGPSGGLGYSLAMDAGTIVAGHPFDDDALDNAGSVYVFPRPAQGWENATQSAVLTPDDAVRFGFVGSSVAVAGSTVVAGAAIGDDGQRGSVYVFDKRQGAWADATQTAKLTADDGVDGDELGFSVALGGGRVFAGAFRHDSQRGAVYVYDKPQGGWADTVQSLKLTADDGAAGDAFGQSLGIDGGTLVAGAPGNDGNGAAYVFAGRPDAPSGVSAVPGDRQAQVSWNAPGEDGGAVVTGYTATASPGGESCSTTGTTSCTIEGLANGTGYTVSVTAANRAGNSAPSERSAQFTPLAAPGPMPTTTPAPTSPAPSAPAPTSSPAPSSSAPPTSTPAQRAAVRVKAKNARSRLFVKVRPKVGAKKQWRFVVQKKKAQNKKRSWQKVKITRTTGKKRIRTLNLRKGIYRVKVKPAYGYAGVTSKRVRLKR